MVFGSSRKGERRGRGDFAHRTDSLGFASHQHNRHRNQPGVATGWGTAGAPTPARLVWGCWRSLRACRKDPDLSPQHDRPRKRRRRTDVVERVGCGGAKQKKRVTTPAVGQHAVGAWVTKIRYRGRRGGGEGRLVKQQRPGAAQFSLANRTCTAPGFGFFVGGAWRRRLAERVVWLVCVVSWGRERARPVSFSCC